MPPQTQTPVPDSVSGFSDYFRLTPYPAVALAGLGYGYDLATIALPYTDEPLSWVETLDTYLRDTLQVAPLTGEASRREFVIAPVLVRVALHVGAQVLSEFELQVDKRLHGSLDYLVQAQAHFVVVEAKQTDMTRGFTQLAAELVAVDLWNPNDAPLLYGAVTVGDVWRFGMLNRAEKRVTQSLSLFTLPDDLEQLARSLVAILRGLPPAT